MSWIANINDQHPLQPGESGECQPLREAVLHTLELRFGTVPPASVSCVQKVCDTQQLWHLLYDAMTTPTLANFGHLVEEQR